MKLTEFITQLKDLETLHGNIDVIAPCADDWCILKPPILIVENETWRDTVLIVQPPHTEDSRRP